MKRWQKFALLAATPTVTALHERWIAHLLGIDFAAGDPFVKVMGVLTVTGTIGCIIAITWEKP